MTAIARLLEQRSVGHVHLRMERDGIAVMREAGSAKCRMPRGSTDAILINTSGGLAGGDVVDIKAEVGRDATLTLTTQAAERIYRTLGPAAEVHVHLSVEAGGSLYWMPQESIFFEGSALHRWLDVDLAEGATFLAIEPMVFGRLEMGERVKKISVVDHWKIKRAGKLFHAETFRLGPEWSNSLASFSDNHATCSLFFVSSKTDFLLDRIRTVLGPQDGASAWNGKLVVRLLAKDGFHLRKTLIKVLAACVGHNRLSTCWKT